MHGLGLTVEMRSPRLHVVRWRQDEVAGEASEAERVELAKLAASRIAGAHVLLIAPSSAAPLPSEFAELIGGAPPIAIEGGEVFAPRGRGRVVRLWELIPDFEAGSDVRALERFVDDATAAAFERVASARFVRDDLRDGMRTAPSPFAGDLVPAELDPANPRHAQAYSHSIELPGSRTPADRDLYVASGRGGHPHLGVLVRGTESFELAPRADGRPLEGFELVLLRLTEPSDRAALLRVHLDDEDLGPWRLGVTQRPPQEWSPDEFTISSDLLAGRAKFRLRFTTADDRSIGSFRWSFFARRETRGTWLTSIEPLVVAPDPGSVTRFTTSSQELGSLQRGVTMRPGTRVEYQLPRGYRRFVTGVFLGGRIETPRPVYEDRRATLSIEVNGRFVARYEASSEHTSTSVDVGIEDARTLALQCDSSTTVEASLGLLEPQLLR